MPDLWYRALLRAVTMIYYRRVRAVPLAPLSLDGRPVLFVGLHRNGAVDGMLYKRVFPRAVFVVARQLVRGWFARLFFTGIPVAREQDERDAQHRRDNPRALAAAADHLVGGGQLFVLPEGTSDLGPRHLPFKPGAAKIILDTLERGVTPVVVPVGIFYEAPAAFRSDACVVTGAPIDVTLPPSVHDRSTRIAVLMTRITAGLEAVAVQAEDACTLHRIEILAALADDSMGGSRWRVQKLLAERPLAARVNDHWTRLSQQIVDGRVAVDRAGVPRFSRRGALWNAAWCVVQLVIVALAWTANALPLAGAWYAGKRLSDALNTVALWRMLIGAPITFAWWLGVIAIAAFTHAPWVIAAYVTITLAGLIAYPKLCVRMPMLRNALRRLSREDVDAIGGWIRAAAGERSDG